MTKPKTTAQLLAEANKLAMEMGFTVVTHKTTYKSWICRADNYEIFTSISTCLPTKAHSLRCLIAALREVPVVKKWKKK